MLVQHSELLPLQREEDVVLVRKTVKACCERLGFKLVDVTKVVTASSELGRNAVVHGGGGTALVEAITDGLREGLKITFQDNGPGIDDIGLALRDGYSTGGGMGLGLGGSKRLVNEFQVSSQVGKGTRVVITQWRRH